MKKLSDVSVRILGCFNNNPNKELAGCHINLLTDKKIGRGTLYDALTRFESWGWLKSRKEINHQGRRPPYVLYKLTDLGLKESVNFERLNNETKNKSRIA